MPPLVTAVIPVFNGARFVSQAIDSVLGQTYPDVECVVVDDGSTDDTPAVVAGFSNVVYVRQDNQGVAAARNRGAREAKGALLAFLDADDVWLPEKLEKQLALFAGPSTFGLVYCGMTLVDADLRVLGSLPAPSPDLGVRNTLLLEPPVVSVAQTGVIPCEVFSAIRGFDERLSTSADSDLVCRIGLRYTCACVPEPLAMYRTHADQMHLSPDAMRRDMELVYEKVFTDPDLPPELRKLEGRARANLYGSLAGEYLARRDFRKTVTYGWSALRADPSRALALLRRKLGRG